ncbi:unnamed protein product [Heterobilharzia americana]|nr:unnamed protein product [Heterobilharzia americana]
MIKDKKTILNKSIHQSIECLSQLYTPCSLNRKTDNFHHKFLLDKCNHSKFLQNIFNSVYNPNKIPISINLLKRCKRLIKLIRNIQENCINILLSNSSSEEDYYLLYKTILYRYECYGYR